MGNHDSYYAHLGHGWRSVLFWFRHDRRWFFRLPLGLRDTIQSSLITLPLVIEVTGSNSFIVMHGDGMGKRSISELKDYLENGNLIQKIYFMWSRRFAKRIIKGKELNTIDNVSFCFHGHTVNKKSYQKYQSKNHIFLDTGAGYIGTEEKAKLTILKITSDMTNSQQERF